MTVVLDAINSGYLNIYDASSVFLAAVPLASTAGTVSGGVLTLNAAGMTEASADASGTAASATVTTTKNGGTVLLSGLTVSSTSGDIVLSSTTIVAGSPVTFTAASITSG
jgi:hypothetical protein